MISDKMLEALNTQINEEWYSAYLYMSMSAYASDQGLSGVPNWFRVQYGEEMTHAMKFYDYIIEQGGRVRLKAIQEPDHEFESVEAIFSGALDHERHITGCINELVSLAIEEKDYATHTFLQWFVTEQVEEEAHASDVLSRIRLVGQDGRGLLLIDNQLAQRAPAAEQE